MQGATSKKGDYEYSCISWTEKGYTSDRILSIRLI